MPKLSVIVIIYRMPRQAANTLRSLSILQQKNVSIDDYEIIAVENASDSMLDEGILPTLGPNLHYYRRTESGVSPAPAINFALSKARGTVIGLIIDGARMVTPRVIEYALKAHTASTDAITCVPGYFIGPCEHQFSAEHGYTEAVEQAALERMRWQENPYRLFDFSTLSAANPQGTFQPFMECNCFFTSRENFNRIEGADERFDEPGGGAINMHIFRKIGILPNCLHYFVLPGEGSFHQLHGGVTTSPKTDRKELLFEFRDKLLSVWHDEPFHALMREPILLGCITSHAQKYLNYSSKRARIRFHRLADRKEIFWKDDLRFLRWTKQA